MASEFMAMRWSMVIGDQPGFITTDHPVTFIHPSLEFRGLKNPETMILFPISPTRLLIMDNRMTEPAGQYYPTKDGVAPWNLLLWREANEYMFSHRDPDEVCAELMTAAERLEAAGAG